MKTQCLRIISFVSFLNLFESQALISANKRVIQILKKVQDTHENINPSLFVESEEKALWDHIQHMEPALNELMHQQDYVQVMSHLATYKDLVDNFFNSVMVMSEDKSLRNNRIALLMRMSKQFNCVVDLEALSY